MLTKIEKKDLYQLFGELNADRLMMTSKANLLHLCESQLSHCKIKVSENSEISIIYIYINFCDDWV